VTRAELALTIAFALGIFINVFVNTKWAKANRPKATNVLLACGAAGTAADAFGGSPLFWVNAAVLGSVTVYAYHVDRKRRRRLKNQETSK
jgi:Flp pilus assembly protein TadB